MDVLERIDKRDLKELLGKGWMTHDGMWFFHCCRELGIEQANRLNRAAIASLAVFEVARMKEVLGLEKDRLETFEEMKLFFDGALGLVIPSFMKFTFESPEKNLIRWEWEKDNCFAYKGVKRIGVLGGYRCGVMYRIDRWLDCLKVRYQGEKIEECRMHTRGACAGEYRFFFDE